MSGPFPPSPRLPVFEPKAASVAWATRDELAVEPARPAVEREPRATQPEATGSKEPARDSLRAKVQAALEARQRGAAEIPQQDAVEREALRGELRAMDREALRQAAYADNRSDGFEQSLLLVTPRGADSTPDFALAQKEITMIDEP